MDAHNFFQANEKLAKRCPACGKKHKLKALVHEQYQELPSGVLFQWIPVYVCHKAKKAMLGTRATIMLMCTEMWVHETDEYPSMQ
jgi:hypothetical protein